MRIITRRELRSAAQRCAVACLGICTLIVLPACSSSGRASVALIGDSITTGDRQAVQRRLEPKYDLTVSGHFGATARAVLPAARKVAQQGDFDQVIINLGTNDVRGDVAVQLTMEAIGSIVDAFAGARCVYLVDINEHMLSPAPGSASSTAGAQRLNQALRDMASERPLVEMIPWNAEIEKTLDGARPPTSSLTKDSVHPNTKGNRRLNDLYASALSSCDG